MAYNFSRRDFMKCAGVTVLAVAAGGLLTGCGGNLDTKGYIPAKTDIGITVDNTPDKAVARVMGWQDGWTPKDSGILSSLEKFASQIVGGNSNMTWISVVFKVQNNTNKTIELGSTGEAALNSVLLALTTGNYDRLDQLGRQNFEITSDRGHVYHADIGYQSGADGLPNAYSNTLAPNATGFIKMYCILPSRWEKLSLTYKPDYAKDQSIRFVLTKGDKMA